MDIIKDFKKDVTYKGQDKISITPSKICFLSKFIVNNHLASNRFVDLYLDKKERRLGFIFNEKGSFSLGKIASPNYRYIFPSKNMIKEMKISKKDYRKYDYETHTSDGKEFFIIQLDKKST